MLFCRSRGYTKIVSRYIHTTDYRDISSQALRLIYIIQLIHTYSFDSFDGICTNFQQFNMFNNRRTIRIRSKPFEKWIDLYNPDCTEIPIYKVKLEIGAIHIVQNLHISAVRRCLLRDLKLLLKISKLVWFLVQYTIFRQF